MRKFLQKALCKCGLHQNPRPEAGDAVQDDGTPVVRIRIFCPACDKSMLWIDISNYGNTTPRFTRRGETLH